MNASDLLQIIVLPAQLIPAAASTRDPLPIAASSGQHRAVTSNDRLSDDCLTNNCPTDIDLPSIAPPTITSPMIDLLSLLLRLQAPPILFR
jgi:hypothetical protein